MNLAASLFAHLIGDYLLQNDWQAIGKKRCSWICTVHVLLYLVPFLFTGASLVQLALIGLQHWAQDRTDFVPWFMHVTGKRQFGQPPLAPWSHIITDNALHLAWVWFVATAL